jgi:hypothetical protein
MSRTIHLTSIIKSESLKMLKLQITHQQYMSTLLQQQHHTAMSCLCCIITVVYTSCAVHANIRINIGIKKISPG